MTFNKNNWDKDYPITNAGLSVLKAEDKARWERENKKSKKQNGA